MKEISIIEQLELIAEKLKTLKASDVEGVEEALKYFCLYELEISTIMDEVLGEVSRCLCEDLSDDDYKKRLDQLIRKISGK